MQKKSSSPIATASQPLIAKFMATLKIFSGIKFARILGLGIK
jgi:hypothetical protein